MTELFMKYAIIAAGEGSRLAEEGIITPKPLVKINNEALIDRLLRIFLGNDAEEVVVICNERYSDVAKHLHDIQEKGMNGQKVPLKVIVKTTPSSMHSFYEISKVLHAQSFCLTTVDTIFAEDDFKDYISQFKKTVSEGDDGLMGVTDFIDDEKPLYAEVDSHMNISGFYDSSSECRWISAGIYGLTHKCVGILESCIGKGESRMRNFQRALIADGMKLKAYPFHKVFDIDHAADIQKAERFLCNRE